MKHERIWLKSNRLASVCYSGGDFAATQFQVCDGQKTIVLDEESAESLSLFIVRMMKEARDANL